MASVNYVTVDVFTKEIYAGNQLAIVQVPATGLTQEQKQAVAKEFNYSETTFVHPQSPSSDNTWSVDIFTPDQELPFAGHRYFECSTYLVRVKLTFCVVSLCYFDEQKSSWLHITK